MKLMIEAHVNYLIDLLKNSLQFREEKRDENKNDRLKQAQQVFDASLETVCLQIQNYEHEDLLLCGIYWILSSLFLLSPNASVTCHIKKVLCDTSSKLEKIVLSCFNPTLGGFSFTTEHNDPDTILSTMYAVQCLTLLKYDMILQRNNIITYVCSLQNRETGAFYFSSAPWMQLECDLRASLCALVTLNHLNALQECCFQTTGNASTLIDVELLTDCICSSQNDDGGFGCSPGNESHAGFTYCAIASLVLLKKLSFFSQDANRFNKLCWYLASRHLQNDKDSPTYVCNGRVGKPADVCYSWWVLATIILLTQNATQHCVLHYLNNKQEINWYEYTEQLGRGILKFQHVQGGFCKNFSSDTKQSSLSYMFSLNEIVSSQALSFNADVYHTFFSLAALSLIVQNHPCQDFVLLSVNPANAFISELPALSEG